MEKTKIDRLREDLKYHMNKGQNLSFGNEYFISAILDIQEYNAFIVSGLRTRISVLESIIRAQGEG